MTQRPSRGKTRRKCSSDERWSASAPMLQDLRNRANTALGHICDEDAPAPHSNDYANHLTFFTEAVTRLEARSARARQLVEERGRGLLERAFSRVFSHILNADPNFDFDAAITPVPTAVRGNLARWVEDNVGVLVKAFTSEDDVVMVVANEGDVVDNGDGGITDGGDDTDEDDDDASDASVGDVASDISG